MTEDPNLDPNTERQLERIAEIARNVRATWFLLVGVLAFASVTLLGVADADFFAYGRQTSLPLVGVDIPTRSFFLTAPILVAALYVYFHFQLRQLWMALAQPRAETLPFVYPGLLTDWGLRLRADDPGDGTLLDGLQRAVVLLLVWCAAPVVLLGFWWRAMPAHEEWLTLANAAVLLVAVFVGYGTWGEARRRLRGTERSRSAWRNLAGAVAWSAVLAGLAVISWSRTEGGLDHYAPLAVERWEQALPAADFRYDEDAGRWSSPLRPGLAAVANAMQRVKARYADDEMWAFAPERLFVLAPVDLTGEPLVPRAEDWRDHDVARDAFFDAWCARKDLRCAELSDDDRAARNVAWEEERTATLASAPQLLRRGADLRGGRLGGAYAPAADLRGARLDGAILGLARLEGADLRGARLQGATLFEARLEGADLRGARLEVAYLISARLNGADLGGARLEEAFLIRANLRGARLERAYLSGALLQQADLSGARLEGADLGEARLEGADLGEARLEGARLNSASLNTARLARSVLNDAEFAGVEDLIQAQLEDAIGNQNTRLPRDAETGEPLYVWSCIHELPQVWQLRWTEEQREAALCNGRPREKVGRLVE